MRALPIVMVFPLPHATSPLPAQAPVPAPVADRASQCLALRVTLGARGG